MPDQPPTTEALSSASIAALTQRALAAGSTTESTDKREDGAEPHQLDESAEDCSGLSDGVAPVGTRRRPQGIVTVACALLATCALAFAAISILEWSRATRDTGARDAAARDSVLTQARIDIAVLNTIDYTKASTGLQRWASATTGGLHDQIASSLTTAAKTITGTKTSTTAVVVAAAVTSLDVQHGTSTVIASVQLTKTPDAGQSVVDRNRLKATMTRVAGTWRVSDLAAVSVELP